MEDVITPSQNKSNRRAKVLQFSIVGLLVGVIGVWALLATHADTSSQNPAHDIAQNKVVGFGQSTTDLYKDVNDGTNFSQADDNGSYVRGENGAPESDHTVSYAPLASSTTVTKVSVNLRAYRGSASGGSAQVVLYNGTQQIGTGAVHVLGASYANYTDTFSNLKLAGPQLRTKVILNNSGTSGAPRYTMVWADVTLGNSSNPTPVPTPTPTPTPPVVPGTSGDVIRAAFYYPWFPETWGSTASNPFTNYHPTLGFYNSSDTAVIAKHVAALQYAHLNAGISSWWGQGQHQENTRFPAQLAATKGTNFKWALYYEKEGFGDPAVSELTSDLNYIKTQYAANPNYLLKSGKPVIFVYGDSADGCSMADRWKQANSAAGNNFYVVLKVFSGYAGCASQPNGWHQYAPSSAEDHQTGNSFVISPGFNKKGESAPRLTRDISRWKQNIKDMMASNEPWQLVTTFDEWGEGTAVESAQEWSSASGYGSYIDALHDVLPDPGSATGTTPPPTNDPVIAAAGDIACDPTDPLFAGTTATACQMRATAAIINAINPQSVLVLGDNQYESGTLANYNASYNQSWGAFKAKTRPVIGNHEGGEGGSNTGYFDYFNGAGAQSGAAGNRSQGYYSYNIGKWHIVALNSNCGTYIFNGSTSGCQAGSAQDKWLKADLAANPTACTLAYWHVPRFTSGNSHHNDAAHDTTYTTLWNDLYAAGADVVLNGHDHDYERFQPLDPNGKVDTAHGIAEFVVGTGGKTEYTFGATVSGSAIRGDGYGALQLTLHNSSYDWKFVNAAGSNISDSGTAQCHSGSTTPPPTDTQPPTAPSSLTGSAANATTVNLKWGASTDNVQVNQYRIYRNGNTISSVSSNATTYSDTSALPSITYDYQVSAVDLAGNESALSNKISVTTPASTTKDTSAPTAPSNLKYNLVSNTQLNLTWGASTDNVGVAGYAVSRDGTVLNSSITGTSYGDNTISTGQTYVYSVTARDAAGNTSPAVSLSVTTAVAPPPPPTGSGPCGLTAKAPAKYKHVIWIWMENKSYSSVIGNAAAPYETSLANQCATNKLMSDAGHQYNSLSNYIAGTSGLDSCSGGTGCNGNSTWNDCTFNASSCHSPNDNLFRQVRTAGGTAKSFEEDMPSNCYQTNSGIYAIRHNPAAYYTGGTDQAACKSDDLPMGTLTGGSFVSALASDNSLPTFSFVTPNVCNDTHNSGCTVARGDAWLNSWMQLILNSPAYQSGDTAIAVWQDEDTPIPNVVVAPSIKHVVLSDGSYSHYSLLRSTEEMLSLPTLGKASSAPSLRTPYNL